MKFATDGQQREIFLDPQSLYRHARQVIPGGTQLLSKRPEMFLPDQWPVYYQSAKGAEVTGIDGRTFLDMSYCGIGATILGFADADVDRAVKAAIDQGAMSTLNCPEEVELADVMIGITPGTDMARFARSGGEAMSIAIRIARAATGRDNVAFCGYHGWHDWYLSANLAENSQLDGHLLPGLMPRGVPRGLKGLMHAFEYNDVAAIKEIASAHAQNLAAIVLEPVRSVEPTQEFVKALNELARATGAVLIIDEVTAGLRINHGGAHSVYGYTPDIAVFAKALGNGYPVAAVVGKRAVMEAAQETFISSTSWTERVGTVAALATLRKHRERDVAAHLVRIGSLIKNGWEDVAREVGLEITVSGIDPLGHFGFAKSGPESKTLFTQSMLDRGILGTTSFYAMYAHTDAHVDRYLSAVREVFSEIAKAQHEGKLVERLRGPVAHTAFKRLTG